MAGDEWARERVFETVGAHDTSRTRCSRDPLKLSEDENASPLDQERPIGTK
jgi:hypothetical protein